MAAVQVALEVDDVQQQRQWASTEVRAYVLTDHDFNALQQSLLPLWLQRRILGAGSGSPTVQGNEAADASAEPFQHMAGCERVGVEVSISADVRSRSPDRLSLSPFLCRLRMQRRGPLLKCRANRDVGSTLHRTRIEIMPRGPRDGHSHVRTSVLSSHSLDFCPMRLPTAPPRLCAGSAAPGASLLRPPAHIFVGMNGTGGGP